MIVRVWHGRTSLQKADEYAAFLVRRAIPDYRAIEGNLGAFVLQRREEHAAHFLTVSLWPSAEAVRRFAGDDYELAKYYEEDEAYLLEFETTVKHYDLEGGDYVSDNALRKAIAL
jgi:heme-degrading monooxygenase HmoA